MVRLLALIFISLYAASDASLLSAPQQQQLVTTNQGGPVHATEGWSYVDCGQSLAPYMSLVIHLFPSFRRSF